MAKTLYLECNSGISGDMSVAMLLDLGADEMVLRDALASLPLEGYEVKISRVEKNGIDCCDFDVVLEEDNHDHDMEYLYHEEDEEHYENSHEHHHHHHHDHGHSHEHEHHHSHRHLAEIEAIIDGGQLPERANRLAKRIFHIIAEAESKAHNLPLDQVGFHEVGAVDSIVDIVAFAVCFDNLGIQEVSVPKLCEGTGVVRCQHGILPVPVPAVTNILENSGIPLEILPYKGEFVTPTGVAIVKAIRTGGEYPAGAMLIRTGLGAGKRVTERANILRGMILEIPEETVKNPSEAHCTEAEPEDLWKLEADIDDSTGEMLGYTLERLLAEGARDAHYLPCYMKKNRPAWQLQVICDESHRENLEELIFRETTTIGIRRIALERTALARRIETVKTPFGNIRIKVCRGIEGKNFFPEYEDVAKIAGEYGISYREVYRIAQNEAEKALRKKG